jgi:hypothetical protein
MAKNRRPRLTRQSVAESCADLALDRGRSGTVDLLFRAIDELAHVHDPIWEDVSALAVVGRSIFCTCDETATIERVMLDTRGREAAEHTNFALGEAFDLPDGPSGEMDIEGLAIADGYLWICGSHSLKRDDPGEDGLEDMADIDWDPNRGFLGRVPLVDRGEGVFEPVAAIDALDGIPGRRAGMVKMRKSSRTPIRKMLAKDELIGPFVEHPCKENGLDIEGLAVRGNTVLLGLRGPVIGGHAMIVRMEMKETRPGVLKPRKLANGRRYQLQAVDLDGQAIRDLEWQDDRLLLLTGATTDLEAMQSVVMIADYDPDRTVYPAGLLARVLDLPAIRGSDHAEGLASIRIDGQEKLLVAYDSPHETRTDAAKRRLTTDLFEVAGGAAPQDRPAKVRKGGRKRKARSPNNA